MYNNELKVKFIRETNKSIKRADFFQFVFNRLEQYEEMYGVDFCAMSIDQMTEAFDAMGLVKESSFSMYANALRDYSRWCVDQRVPGANMNILQVKDQGYSAIKKKMVASPQQLQEFLDLVFDDECMETTDNIYRAYFWLAFSGIPEQLIFDLKCRDVTNDGNFVYAEWVRYRIRKEGVSSIKNCSTLSSFLYLNSNYTKPGGIRRDRVSGDQLLRGIRGLFTKTIANSMVQKVIRKANNENKTIMFPTYQTIWLSGKFFSIYQREQLGLEPDFFELSEEYLKGKKCTGVRTREERLRTTARGYETDYARWKGAFNL